MGRCASLFDWMRFLIIVLIFVCSFLTRSWTAWIGQVTGRLSVGIGRLVKPRLGWHDSLVPHSVIIICIHDHKCTLRTRFEWRPKYFILQVKRVENTKSQDKISLLCVIASLVSSSRYIFIYLGFAVGSFTKCFYYMHYTNHYTGPAGLLSHPKNKAVMAKYLKSSAQVPYAHTGLEPTHACS